MAEVLKQIGERSSQHVVSSRKVIGFNLSDLAEESRQKIESCRDTVKSMLAEAEVEAEQIRETARLEGYQIGLKEAEERIAKEINEQAEIKAKEKLDRLHDSVTELYSVHGEWMRQYADSLTQFATAIAERVVRQQLHSSPDIILQWVQESLSQLRLSSEIKLTLHPDTMSEIGESLEIMIRNEGRIEEIELASDSNLGRHEVVVSQEQGEIHAGMMAQLNRLGDMLS